ncbi:hypothetical protein [Streptomyces cathayae]|uniref:Uncharacterized protein n=1 Tax=Streptomyces cathayae TaxID=3031124 RepID=A0ABY8JS89_9ACTN|nr:hypothetical protein [Streptomyces sp. HUAS 5]WGD38720.1 hypothetical protein PYS65_00165 [Streptomyces sp. HUAS 5]
MAVAIVDAVRLAKANRRRYERLLECHEELNQRAAAENAAQHKARQTLYDEALVPFYDVFRRLKHADLVDLAAIEMPTVGGDVDIVLRRLRERAVTAAVGALAAARSQVTAPGQAPTSRWAPSPPPRPARRYRGCPGRPPPVPRSHGWEAGLLPQAVAGWRPGQRCCP